LLFMATVHPDYKGYLYAAIIKHGEPILISEFSASRLRRQIKAKSTTLVERWNEIDPDAYILVIRGYHDKFVFGRPVDLEHLLDHPRPIFGAPMTSMTEN